MQPRETLLNLAITCVLILIIALVAMLLRESRQEPVAAVPVASAGAAAKPASPEESRPVLSKFVALANPEFIDSRANEADALRIRVGGEEHIFVLYFIDAIETSLTNSSRVADQARWFGNTHAQAVVEMGQEAVAYVRDLLTTHPFSVLTRWERVPSTTRYYALVVVEYESGKRAYLADLLVRKGYARIWGISTFLPENDKRTMEDYLHELNDLAKKARNERRGIWAKK